MRNWLETKFVNNDQGIDVAMCICQLLIDMCEVSKHVLDSDFVNNTNL